MLLRLIVRNFLSFDEEVQFEMFPNMKRTLMREHVYEQNRKIPLLKQAVMFGPNASGKSNFVKALNFIRNFAIRRKFIKNIELKRYFHLLKENPLGTPISIVMEFETSNRYFLYEVEIGVNAIVKEALYESFPLEESFELVFERYEDKIKYAKAVEDPKELVSAREELLKKNNMSSVLSLNKDFPVVNDERIKLAFDWIDTKLLILGVNPVIPTLIDLLRKDEEMRRFITKMAYSLEVGFTNLSVEESDLDKWVEENNILATYIPKDFGENESFMYGENSLPVFSIDTVGEIKKVYQIIYEQIGKNGFVGKLDSKSQSDGTLRALTLLPALYFASKKGITIVIDEISHSLSHTMVKAFVEAFAKDKNANGQMICTTHDTQLLDDKDILRSDEIWFVEKKEGASVLYSHNDFKEHPTISWFNGYKEGRYGAIEHVCLLEQ